MLSGTIQRMRTNGAKGQTGDRQDLHAVPAELVERAKTERVEAGC
jgi:hypothetical protein